MPTDLTTVVSAEAVSWQFEVTGVGAFAGGVGLITVTREEEMIVQELVIVFPIYVPIGTMTERSSLVTREQDEVAVFAMNEPIATITP